MFDQQGIWAMNQAHHQELLEVAAKHRLLKMIRSRSPVTLEALRKVASVPAIVSGVVCWRRRWLMEQGLVR